MSNPSESRGKFSNVSNDQPLSIDDLWGDLSKLTDGFPILISGTLCADENDKLVPLDSTAALFAWISKYADVCWKGRVGLTKDEFFQGLRQNVKAYVWATEFPHFPKIAGVYYPRDRPAAKNTGALKKLLDYFAPATPRDEQLILAMILTFFWGGPPGQRPSFVITTDEKADKRKGRGRGKTALGAILSTLVGGFVSFRPHSNLDRAITGLLSPSALTHRVVLVDNLKTCRFSSEFTESLLTASQIDGHRLYAGHASRPNFLTWVFTVNGASFSKDMAERSIVIQLREFEPSPTWYDDVTGFIEENQEEIIADVRWHLKQPCEAMNIPERWQPWANEVLSRLSNPDELLSLIAERREGIDEDDQDSEDAIVHFAAWLESHRHTQDATRARVRIPSGLAVQILRDLKPYKSDRQAQHYLKQLQHPQLRYYCDGNERGYLWVGEKADRRAQVIRISYKP